MDIGSIIGGVSAVAGGIIGGRDAREAERQQREFLRQAREQLGFARGEVDEAEGLAIQDIDEANVILADVEPAILEGLDEQLRIRVAQQVLRQEQERARTQRQLASAGLDATTVMPQVQRQQNLGQADAVGALTAQFAGMRSQAIAGARQAQAQGLMNRAATRGQYAGMQANLYGQESALLGSVQYQPANTGAMIGQIGGAIGNAFTNYEMAQNNQAFQERLLGAVGNSHMTPNHASQLAFNAISRVRL